MKQIECNFYSAGQCRSCQWLEKTYPEQLNDKLRHLLTLLGEENKEILCPPVESPHQAFRNKAKMVVSGSVEKPILGILSPKGQPLDLCDCPLYPPSFGEVFAVLKQFIQRAGLTPYHIVRKRGELKYLLLSESRFTGEMMLRFVLRSETKLTQLRTALSWLQARLPQLAVISVNIQPVHMAIMEGEKEIILTEQVFMQEQFNQLPLYQRPGGFFQTNPEVAAKLYATARDWLVELPIRTIWDLFCGSGGFGLHCVSRQRTLIGSELSAEAIHCARRSAEQLGFSNAQFEAIDSSTFSLQRRDSPDVVIVNPPRRGIGQALCEYLNTTAPDYLLYSSCNASSMAEDLQRMPRMVLRKVQLFDMFPHTPHYEVLALLQRDSE